MKKKWWIVALLPIFYTVLGASEVKLEDIIIKSFTKSNSEIYMSKVLPNFEEFVQVRQKVRSHEKLDINRTKDSYNRKVENILEDWKSIKAKLERENIDMAKAKFIDVERNIDDRMSKIIGKDAVRYTFLNFTQGEKIFSIRVKECVKFENGWRCGGGLSFKETQVEDSASSQLPSKAANTK